MSNFSYQDVPIRHLQLSSLPPKKSQNLLERKKSTVKSPVQKSSQVVSARLKKTQTDKENYLNQLKPFIQRNYYEKREAQNVRYTKRQPNTKCQNQKQNSRQRYAFNIHNGQNSQQNRHYEPKKKEISLQNKPIHQKPITETMGAHSKNVFNRKQYDNSSLSSNDSSIDFLQFEKKSHEPIKGQLKNFPSNSKNLEEYSTKKTDRYEQMLQESFNRNKLEIQDLLLSSVKQRKKIRQSRRNEYSMLQNSNKSTKSKSKKLSFYGCDNIIVRPVQKADDKKQCSRELANQVKIDQNTVNREVRNFKEQQKLYKDNNVVSLQESKNNRAAKLSVCSSKRLHGEKKELESIEPNYHGKGAMSPIMNWPSESKQLEQQQQQTLRKDLCTEKQDDQKNNSNYENQQTMQDSVRRFQVKLQQNQESTLHNIPKQTQKTSNRSINRSFSRGVRNRIFSDCGSGSGFISGLISSRQKMGLKTSKRISRQIERQRLEGILGVDHFHITIETDKITECCL